MEPVTVTAFIARPREEIVAYLSDVANHPEFKDHFLEDWHLLREDSEGQGAGARFRVKLPFNRFSWADYTLVEVTPNRVVERGRSGKFNRNRTMGTWTLTDSPATRPASSTATRPRATCRATACARAAAGGSASRRSRSGGSRRSWRRTATAAVE